ncbi:C4-type zinc ribbon domain-containing protein [Nocardioides sp. CN2-186]|uniref:zinc ribbon domain-containing protein n=1 Tax=Nocardioides tweenelious TaxID=3156607 RepID=UPI0032B5AF2B
MDLAPGGGGAAACGAGRYGGDPGEHHPDRPLAVPHLIEEHPLKADPAAQLKLLDLQELDARADQLRHQRAHLPELARITELETSRTELDNQARDLRIVVDDLNVEQRKVDLDVEQVKTRRKRDQDRMDQGLITNPKDLERMQHEMVSLERRISSLEDDELEVMGRLEDAQRDLDQLELQIANIDEQLATLGSSRDSAGAGVEAELADLVERRGPIAAEVPDDLLALYEKLRASKNGVGAAALLQRRCSGCQLTLDPSEIARIRTLSEDEVIRCEECTRILVRTAESGV